MFKDHVIRSPINKTAAVVSNQAECTSEISLEDQRAGLVRLINNMETNIKGLSKNNPKRIATGIQVHSIHAEIREINKKLKKQKEAQRIFDKDLNAYILQECKKRLSADGWMNIIYAARKAKEEDLLSAGIKERAQC